MAVHIWNKLTYIYFDVKKNPGIIPLRAANMNRAWKNRNPFGNLSISSGVNLIQLIGITATFIRSDRLCVQRHGRGQRYRRSAVPAGHVRSDAD